VSYQCPCGCALQLDARQVALEMRMARIAGNEPRHVDLSPRGRPAAALELEPEPTSEAICRTCGVRHEIPEFIAEFIARNTQHVSWPSCTACVAKGRAA
jgi:hypothetical protein